MASHLDDSVTQGLMTSAYEKFNCMEGGFSLGGRWRASGLTNRERVAVLLGNLHYQVINGGLTQWFDNGYGLEKGPNGKPVHVVLAGLADRHYDADPKIADAIIRMMNAVEKTIRQLGPDPSRTRWTDDEDEETEEACPELAGADAAYCRFGDKRFAAFFDAVVAAHPEEDDPFETDFSFYRLSDRMRAQLDACDGAARRDSEPAPGLGR